MAVLKVRKTKIKFAKERYSAQTTMVISQQLILHSLS